MIAAMLPAFLFAMYEKDGMHLEQILWNIVRVKWIRPAVRTYEMEGFSENGETGKGEPKRPGKLQRAGKEAGNRKEDFVAWFAEKKITVQDTIPYQEMARDGICKVRDRTYSKTVQFYDINYQLAQDEDKNAIFEGWCDFLNYFDPSIHFQFSFLNQKSNMREYRDIIKIPLREDGLDDYRIEYSGMLQRQLAHGNNGLVKRKYLTFSIEAENIAKARPRLERIETDILNNFKMLGVIANPLSGKERLKILYEIFHPDEQLQFCFDYDDMVTSGLTTKDYIAPTSFVLSQEKISAWEIRSGNVLICSCSRRRSRMTF